MAECQTWFGGALYLAYGIQLLPLTPVAERRDSPEWARELFEPFAASCDSNFQDCRDQGWSVLVLAMLATVGHRDEAIRKALELPAEVFTSAGGNGHSMTNTLWYLATRPQVDDPLVIDDTKTGKDNQQTAGIEKEMYRQSDNPENDINGQPSTPSEPYPMINPNFNCSCPDTCDENALNRFAHGHTCGARIIWLMKERGHNEWDACHQVGVELPQFCAACDPSKCKAAEEEVHLKTCPSCSKEVCQGKLNQCPIQSAPFLCTEGSSMGGCSASAWTLENGVCDECCELSLGCH